MKFNSTLEIVETVGMLQLGRVSGEYVSID